jgi:hypothetical protein
MSFPLLPLLETVKVRDNGFYKEYDTKKAVG